MSSTWCELTLKFELASDDSADSSTPPPAVDDVQQVPAMRRLSLGYATIRSVSATKSCVLSTVVLINEYECH